MTESPIISVRELACTRVQGSSPVRIEIPELEIAAGALTILTGGPENHLLLRLLGLLDAPDSGELHFDGNPTAHLTDDARVALRTKRCGYVFESPFLLPAFTVLENIAMPAFKICQIDAIEARRRTEDLMNFSGISDFAESRDVPIPMQYRVALARALAIRPVAIFVERLDSLLSSEELPGFRDLLHEATTRYGVAVVASTEPGWAVRKGERRLSMLDGRLEKEASL